MSDPFISPRSRESVRRTPCGGVRIFLDGIPGAQVPGAQVTGWGGFGGGEKRWARWGDWVGFGFAVGSVLGTTDDTDFFFSPRRARRDTKVFYYGKENVVVHHEGTRRN